MLPLTLRFLLINLASPGQDAPCYPLDAERSQPLHPLLPPTRPLRVHIRGRNYLLFTSQGALGPRSQVEKEQQYILLERNDARVRQGRGEGVEDHD